MNITRLSLPTMQIAPNPAFGMAWQFPREGQVLGPKEKQFTPPSDGKPRIEMNPENVALLHRYETWIRNIENNAPMKTNTLKLTSEFSQD